MCGIFGLSGTENVAPLLVDGLERLEYRGYDSCGVVVLDRDRQLTLKKGVGEVARVRREERFQDLEGTSGLGHTRWATHGRVSRINAHPHFDSYRDIAIVHNGILENHDELRRGLEARGHTFISETDSEVIAHLVEEELKKSPSDFEEALLACARALAGSFAIGVITSHTPGVLYGVRKESPLLVGQGDGFTCLASDPLAFSTLTPTVAFVEDNELVAIDTAGFRIRRIEDGAVVERDVVTLDLDARRAELGEFPDFMSKEIHENAAVARIALAAPAAALDELATAIHDARVTYLTGMGTAYYVALMAEYAFARFSGVFLPALSADEMPYLVHFRPGDHVLAISQSGETYDTLRALRPAREGGASTSAILNVPSSSMAREVDRYVDQQAGPEICVLSTKSTISQLTLLLRTALRLGDLNGHLTPGESRRRHEELEHLPDLLESVWDRSHARLRDMARRFSVIRNWFFLGRGIYHGLAMEAALKFKEVTYCHAEGMPAGFLKHGTISLIDEAMHTAIFLPDQEDEALRTQSLGAVTEINARGGSVVAFQPEGIGDRQGLFTEVIDYPSRGPLSAPLGALMQAQLFAYYTARALGRNVDKPRSLAKSVTVG